MLLILNCELRDVVSFRTWLKLGKSDSMLNSWNTSNDMPNLSLLYSEDLDFSKLVAEVVYVPDNDLVLCRLNTSQYPAFDVASMERGSYPSACKQSLTIFFFLVSCCRLVHSSNGFFKYSLRWSLPLIIFSYICTLFCNSSTCFSRYRRFVISACSSSVSCFVLNT